MSLLSAIVRKVILAEGVLHEVRSALMPDDLTPASIAIAQYMVMAMPNVYRRDPNNRIFRVVRGDGTLLPDTVRDLKGAKKAGEFDKTTRDLIAQLGDPRAVDEDVILQKIANHYNAVSSRPAAVQKKDLLFLRMTAGKKQYNDMLFPSYVLSEILPKAIKQREKVSIGRMPSGLEAALRMKNDTEQLISLLPDAGLSSDEESALREAANEILETLAQIGKELEPPSDDDGGVAPTMIMRESVFEFDDEDLLGAVAPKADSSIDIEGEQALSSVDTAGGIPEEATDESAGFEQLYDAYLSVKDDLSDLEKQIEDLEQNRGFDIGGALALLEIITSNVVSIGRIVD
jgi:hypothetical protein